MATTLFAPALVASKPSERGQALARAYDEHAPAVYGLARRVTRDDAVAARLTADVFGDLDTITDERPLAECLLTDVHRRAVAWVRDTAAVSGISRDEPALSKLPSIQRQVIAAAYFDGMTCMQIAQQFALDLADVVEHMQRGLRRLAVLSQATPAR